MATLIALWHVRFNCSDDLVIFVYYVLLGSRKTLELFKDSLLVEEITSSPRKFVWAAVDDFYVLDGMILNRMVNHVGGALVSVHSGSQFSEPTHHEGRGKRGVILIH